MPELPEVQTVVNDLNEKILGMKILNFWTEHPKSIKNDLIDFNRKIVNARIIMVKRRAKNILIFLDNDWLILVHLKMTGHLLLKQSGVIDDSRYFDEKVNGYIRHSWTLEDDQNNFFKLEFSDLRKFGKIMIFEKKGYLKHPELVHFGLEPLSSEFTLEKFHQLLNKSLNKMIRVFLLDQDKIAGVGNIYVSEILFKAGVNPKRKIKDLSQEEISLIYKCTITILKEAVKMRGTTDSDYRDTAGAPGGFQKKLKVYNRENMPCKKKGCQGRVMREKIAQRSSYWCYQCQI